VNAADTTTTKDLTATCERVEQETPYFCGAACCEMIFEALGIRSTQTLNYSLIHDDQRFSVEQLYSDPTGIRICLNKELNGKNNFTCMPFVSTISEDVLRELVFCVAELEFPCICLVQKGNHWVVVDDVRIQADNSPSRKVCGVFVQNPWYNSPSSKYVGVDEFFNGWLTPIAWGITWKDSLVIISDGNKHPSYGVEKAKISVGNLSIQSLTSAASPLQNLLAAHGFRDFTSIAGGGAAVTNPIEVQDLGSGQAFIVAPMDASASADFAGFVYVAVDPQTNELLEIAKFSKSLQVSSDDEAQNAGEQRWGKGNFTVLPGFFWERDYFAMSRFRIHRRVIVSSNTYRLFGDGSVEALNGTSVPAGG
jgi:hypothetical protein